MPPKKSTDKKGNDWFLIAAILGGGYLLMNQGGGGGGGRPGFAGSSGGGGRQAGGLLQRLLSNDGDFSTDEDIGILPLTQAADLLPGSPYTVDQAAAIGAATVLTSSYGPVYIPELAPGIYTIPFTTPDEFVLIAQAIESANPGVTISTQYTQRILAAERSQIQEIAALPDYLQGVADAARRKARIEHQISFPNPNITTSQRDFISLHDPDFDFDSLREDTSDPGGLQSVRDAVDTAVAEARASETYDFDDFFDDSDSGGAGGGGGGGGGGSGGGGGGGGGSTSEEDHAEQGEVDELGF